VAPVAPKKPSVPVELPSLIAAPAPDASVVAPVEVRAVNAPELGAVLPIAGGDAKSAAVEELSVAGLMYT